MEAAVSTVQDVATLSITTEDFVIGTAETDCAVCDGYWTYSLNGGETVSVYTSDDLVLTDLPNGDHTILISLVDSTGTALDPVVDQTIEFSTFNGLAECDETVVYTQVADGDYTVATTALAGQYARVTINATMEANYDSIIVTDGAGNQLNTQIDGEFIDADFYSTDGTITVQVLNDGSVQNGDVTLAFACVSLSTPENERLDMIIYPNPVLNGDFVTIQTSVNGDKYVEVFDITGKRLITTTLSADTLDVLSLIHI